jgi:hypothetical protein
LNITVMRLTHDGMRVKSMLGPLVDATREMPSVIARALGSGLVGQRLVSVVPTSVPAGCVP